MVDQFAHIRIHRAMAQHGPFEVCDDCPSETYMLAALEGTRSKLIHVSTPNPEES